MKLKEERKEAKEQKSLEKSKKKKNEVKNDLKPEVLEQKPPRSQRLKELGFAVHLKIKDLN